MDRKYKGIIFDLDGVICHTDRYHYKAWKNMADGLGIYFDEEINKIKIFIPSFLEGLSTVRAMIRVYLREHNISKLDEIQLLSVVDELTTNAVEHAYSDSQGEIEVVLNYYNNTIFLTVEDFGRGFDESLDSKEDGGFGLSIARKLVDVFEIEKKRKGTIIKVEKKIKEAV